MYWISHDLEYKSRLPRSSRKQIILHNSATFSGPGSASKTLLIYNYNPTSITGHRLEFHISISNLCALHLCAANKYI